MSTHSVVPKIYAFSLLTGLTLLPAAALAESSVTLYGVADMNLEYVNHMSASGATVPAGPSGSRVALESGGQAGSRWGIRGTEDLGRNLKAIFVLEAGITLDDGKLGQAGRMFGRQAYVGIDGPYGKLTFGRQYTSVFDTFADFQPARFQPQYEPVVAQYGTLFREDNTAKYMLTLGPLIARAHWSFGVNGASAVTGGEVPGSIRSGSGWGTGVEYLSGPVGLAAAYDDVAPPAVAGGSPGKNRRASIGVNYSGDRYKLTAGYRWGRSLSPAGTETLRDNYYWVGGTYSPYAAIDLILAYYYDDIQQVTNPVNGVRLGNIANPWQVLFVAKYTLSKRTNLYWTTAYAKNASINFDTSVGGLGTGYYLGAGQNNQLATAIGIRHIF